MKSIMTLDDILSYLADLEPQQEEDWINEMIRAQQKRLRKRIKARLEADAKEGRKSDPYGPTHYGALGAEREG